MRKTETKDSPTKDESADYFMMGVATAFIVIVGLAAGVRSLRDQQPQQLPPTKSISSEPNKTEQLPWLFLQSNETPCTGGVQSIPYYLVRSQNSEL